MAPAIFEIEIALARYDGSGAAAGYGIELRFNDPTSQAETGRVFGAQPVRFDPAELRTRSLDPAAYGAYLAAQLLAEPAVRTGFDKATAAAETADAALRLRLVINPGAAELHGLRWETLRLAGSNAPLLTGQNFTFARYLDSLDWRPVRLRPAAELRALVVVADPADAARYRLAPVDRTAELAAARAGLGDIAVTELAARGQATLNNLAAALRAGCDILYLVAHGMLVDGEPWLFLEDAAGAAARIPGRELAACIQELADRPCLVVLASCQSAGAGAAAPAAAAAPLAALGPRLAEAGIPAVLAMQGDITLATAAAFMPVFFRELRRDGLVDRAAAVARGAVRDRPDWWMPVLFSRLKSGRIWGSADDPLFGLPPLPALDLPDKPYRYLDYYRREDAWVFFGRDRKIRALYERVTAADGPPVVLFYGQSGVGKSSLLAAGLLPRLEDSHQVRYARRDQAQGLLGTLAAALKSAPEADLAGAWRAAETAAGRPLLVILDQVEELFTRPNRQQPDEMVIFLAALASLFGDPGRRPRGRLVLSFRKEWLAEIKERLSERTLPCSEVFLERLGREGIIEIVTGPGRTPRLRDQYRLTVGDPLLPGQIADDLLADRESPVAPLLAILLAGMWEAAKARSYDQPAFDEDLYHEFRSRGLKLDDFLGRQLGTLRDKLPEVVDSGLALDLLAYHTTPLGTAEQRTLADLEQTYSHRRDVLPALTQQCRDLYLLVDPARNQPDQPPASRLTHDTQAPHVRKRFDESDKPGQRARRIMESRAASWKNGGDRTTLDDLDLGEVERGMSGTHTWSAPETKLLEASRTAREQRAVQQRTRRIFGIGAIAAIVTALVISAFLLQRWTFARQSEEAVKAERMALSAKDTWQRDRELALLLAIEAAERHQSWVTDDALRTIVAASSGDGAVPIPGASVESWSPDGHYVVGRQDDESAAVFSTQTGQVVKQFAAKGHYSETVPGAPSTQLLFDGGSADVGIARTPSPIDDWSSDSKYLIVLPDHTKVEIWDTHNWSDPITLLGHSSDITEAAWNQQGTLIATASNDGTARIWSFPSGATTHVLRGHTGAVKDIAWSPVGDRVATASLDKTVRVWNSGTGVQELVFEHTEPLQSVVWDPTGRFLASIDLDVDTPKSEPRSVIHVWDTRSTTKVLDLPNDEGQLLPHSIGWSPSGKYLGIASADFKRTFVWNTDTWASQVFDGTRPRWSPKGDRLLMETGDQDSEIVIWDVTADKEIAHFRMHYGQIYSAEWDRDGQSVASTASDGFLRVWSSADATQQIQIKTGFEERHYAEWNPNNLQVAVRDQSGAIVIYDLTISKNPQRLCKLLTRNLSQDEWATFIGDSRYSQTCPGKPVPGVDVPIEATPGSVG